VRLSGVPTLRLSAWEINLLLLSTIQDQFQLLIFDAASADLKNSSPTCFSQNDNFGDLPLFVWHVGSTCTSDFPEENFVCLLIGTLSSNLVAEEIPLSHFVFHLHVDDDDTFA